MPGGKQQFLARINRFTGSRPCGAGEATWSWAVKVVPGTSRNVMQASGKPAPVAMSSCRLAAWCCQLWRGGFHPDNSGTW